MSTPISTLINRSDITPYAQIAIHSREDNMLQPYILAAQNVDVKPALGDPLWYDIITNPYSPFNTILLEGGSYIDGDGNTITFQGLKAALCCFTYARYIMGKNAVDTPFGLVAKKSEYSEQVDSKLLMSIASEKRNEASAYLAECKKYLEANQDDFPLYNSCGKTTGYKFIHKLTGASKI
jgi:hypothetical protein